MISPPSLSFSNSVAGTLTLAGRNPNPRLSTTCSATAAPPRSRSVNPHSSSSTTFYDLLGLRSGATCREIKAAYRQMALQLHPDVAKSDSCSEFIEIHTAYQTLSDPEKRKDYDRNVMLAAMATAGSVRWDEVPRGAQRRRPLYYGRSPRTWETDQCW